MYHNGPSAHNSDGGKFYSSSFSVILLLGILGRVKKKKKHYPKPNEKFNHMLDCGLQAKKT